MSIEGDRVAGFGKLEDGLRQASPWYMWGPYVSERQWGTVREDYSQDGDAWNYLPFDHARSRAYRWGEDGLAGFSDIHQSLCVGLALWNGRDAFLKERPFGLTGPEGNHGEDVKEHWWYTDAVPSHAWNTWRYHYPQAAFPYAGLRTESARRDRRAPEYEILDTGVFDQDRYWVTEVTYAKSDDAAELLIEVKVTNAGHEADTVHVLPTAWFRNTWSWDDSAKPAMKIAANGTGGADDSASGVDIEHPFLGPLELLAATASDGTAPRPLFCENETNNQRLFGCPSVTQYPKDGINDHVVGGAPTVNPQQTGTKCAFCYTVTVQPESTATIRLRLRPKPATGTGKSFGQTFDLVLNQRKAEADEFYQSLTPGGASADEANVMRQAFAGMLWSKQFYQYNVATWLDGDPAQPAPPPDRELNRNARWRSFDAFDILSMPDKWEYPWFAAWDLAFHCVTLAHVDPGFAKYQLVLLCREWFQHPNGALPAYEWDFGDVNPPVHALAEFGANSFDNRGARDGRRAGDCAARPARLSRRGFCRAASRGETWHEAAARGLGDARGRGAAARGAAGVDSRSDLRDQPQEIGHGGGDGRRGQTARHCHGWRFAAVDGAAEKRSPRFDRSGEHDEKSRDARAHRIGRKRASIDGAAENYVGGSGG